jgi:hypothetical protein
LLVRRRRWSVELDELLADDCDSRSPGCSDETVSDLEVADWWHVTMMDAGLAERDKVGRQLLAASRVPGWRP